MSNDSQRKYASVGGSRLKVRSSEALLGICQGIMADNQLNDEEVGFLQCWLEEHSNIADTFPADILIANIKEALEDGYISKEERENLMHTIKAVIGGTMQESGATSGFSTTLPINEEAEVSIKDKHFCFTGTFKFGNRKQCEAATKRAGGLLTKDIIKKLEYLVLGEVATTSWANTSFGRKIEKAVLYQKDGCNLYIISEDMWLNALSK